MKLHPVLFWAFAGAAGLRAVSAAPFEGKIESTITINGHPGQDMAYFIRPNQLRADVTTPRQGVVTLIIDFGKKQLTMVMASQQMYMVRPLDSAALTARAAAVTDEGAAPIPALQKTGETERILGYTCHQYVTTASDGTTFDLWATDQIGDFTGFGSNAIFGHRRGTAGGAGGAAMQSWEKALIGRNFFPLRVVGRDATGGETFRMQVTSVHPQHLADADFAPPPGFRELNLAGITGGGAQP